MGRKARLKQTRTINSPRLVTSEAQVVAYELGARERVIVAALIAITFIVFSPVASHSFLNFDDGQFIYENPHVLNAEAGWAFTSAQTGWYPLTWLSHMIDVA